MKLQRTHTIVAVVALSTWALAHCVEAGGFGGRGGGRGAGMRGGFSGGGGGGGRPSFNTSRPNFSAQRPQMNRSSLNRPAINQPSINRPSTSRPPSFNRPSTSLPHLGGGNFSLPASGANRPSLSNRPNTLPGSGTRPGLGTRPGVGDRPGIGTKPGIGDRPSLDPRPGTGSRPGGSTRPAMPSLPGGKPPSTGDLGDFLGLDGPLRPGNGTRPGLPTTRPDRPSTRPQPGLANRLPGNRPGIGDGRPGNGVARPGLGDGRPGLRPNIDIGEIRVGDNNIIGNRPTWADIDRDRVTQINNRWQNGLDGISDWPSRYPKRLDQYHRWGDHIRGRWGYGRYPLFGPRWWGGHRFRWGSWSYFYVYNTYPYTYWWTTPTYPQLTSWFTWSTSYPTWQQPVYYDYGSGGNVTYEDNRVYIGDQEVASGEEFAQSAAELATVDAPESQDEAEDAAWLPLGTFVLTTDADDVDPSRVVQLAVNKEGVISGVIHNRDTDQTDAIQGQVDKETQRVALRVGESEDIVVETGLYNLTQDEVPVLVHFGTESQDKYLLIRLPEPEASEGTQ
ncbi:MAG: mu-protocadherin- cell-suface protein [Planctomycetota bacterium]